MSDKKVVSSPGTQDLRRQVMERSVENPPVFRASATSLGSYCESIFSPLAATDSLLNNSDRYLDAITHRYRRSEEVRCSLATHNEAAEFQYHADESRRGSCESYNDDLFVTAQVIPTSTPGPVQRNEATASPSAQCDSAQQGENAAISEPLQQGVMSLHLTEVHKKYIQDVCREEIENSEDNLRAEIRHLHLKIIEMFDYQRSIMTELADRYRVNTVLIREVERLLKENEQLRSQH